MINYTQNIFKETSLSLIKLSAFIGLLSGCSSFMNVKSSGSSGGGETVNVRASEIESFRASEPEKPELAVPEFDDIPEDVQIYVQKWLNYFQGRGREHMERYLTRSTRYERLMKRILRENGVPEDIIYIALIESGFSPRAISRSRAVGYWQFIRGTGKRYGLAINTFVDERRDPVLATQAAADYFKGLYGEFNSWFLSMASYNVGEGRVRRETNRLKSRDFWALVKKRRLPKETLNYVPKFLAARLIARKPEAYGFVDLPYEPPIEFETARFEQSINMKTLADKLNVDYAELKRLNPKFRGEVAPVEGRSLELRLPLNTKETALALASEVGVKDLVFVPDQGETDVYKVRSGDTLLKIAKRFKTSVAHLREINDFKRRSRLRPGRTIFVPIPASPMPTRSTVAESSIAKNSSTTTLNGVASSTSATSLSSSSIVADAQSRNNGSANTNTKPVNASQSVVKDADESLYIVQEGESLAEVSVKNNMTMEELMELNSFTEGQVIASGMQLKVKKILPEVGEPSIEDLPSSVDKLVATPSTKETAVVSLPTSTSGSEEVKKEIKKELNTAIETSEDSNKEIFHRVKPGETLIKIAQRYNTTVSALKKMNNLRRRKVLRAGAVLKIPSLPDRKTSSDSSLNRKVLKYFSSKKG